MTITFPRRGEIWLVDFPDDPKSRHALIISVDPRNEFSNSVLAIPVTTNLKPSPTHVRLPAGQGGLQQASMARCENISYILKSRMRRGSFGGTISPALMREIENGLLRATGVIQS